MKRVAPPTNMKRLDHGMASRGSRHTHKKNPSVGVSQDKSGGRGERLPRNPQAQEEPPKTKDNNISRKFGVNITNQPNATKEAGLDASDGA